MLMDALCPISSSKQIAACASSSAISREPKPTCVGEMCARPNVFVHAVSTYRKIFLESAPESLIALIADRKI